MKTAGTALGTHVGGGEPSRFGLGVDDEVVVVFLRRKEVE